MTRDNSKREHKERFLRSENFRLLLTKPSKHMWNVIKITPHGSGEPDSGGLKCANGSRREEDSKVLALRILVCTGGQAPEVDSYR